MAGPFKANEDGVHMIRSRNAMVIPFELVPVYLGKDYTASNLFQLALPLLEAEVL
jgi:hypothetical protein